MQTYTKLKLIQSKHHKYMVALLFPFMSPILKKRNQDTKKSESM